MSTPDPHNGATSPVVHGHATAHTGHTGELPRNATVSYEARDIKVHSIYWYLIALTISVAASFFICIYILRYTERLVSRHDAPIMPARAAMWAIASKRPVEKIPRNADTSRISASTIVARSANIATLRRFSAGS